MNGRAPRRRQCPRRSCLPVARTTAALSIGRHRRGLRSSSPGLAPPSGRRRRCARRHRSARPAPEGCGRGARERPWPAAGSGSRPPSPGPRYGRGSADGRQDWGASPSRASSRRGGGLTYSPQTCGRGCACRLAQHDPQSGPASRAAAPRRPDRRRSPARPRSPSWCLDPADGVAKGKRQLTVVGGPATPAVASRRSQSRRAQDRATETAASWRTSRFMRSTCPARDFDRMAVHVDQPTQPGARFHPLEKPDQLPVIEMMSEQGADHGVEAQRRRQLEHRP